MNGRTGQVLDSPVSRITRRTAYYVETFSRQSILKYPWSFKAVRLTIRAMFHHLRSWLDNRQCAVTGIDLA